MCEEYIELDYWTRDPEKYGDMLRPMFFEQFASQWSVQKSVARAHALYGDYLAATDKPPSSEQLASVLGVSGIAEYIRVGFLLHTLFMRNHGWLPWFILQKHNVAPYFEPLDPAKLPVHLHRHYALSLSDHVKEARRLEALAPKGREKLARNPLRGRPLIDMGKYMLSPAPHFLIEKFSGTGLFYTLGDELGDSFTIPLGEAFESYVLDHLRMLGAAEVHGEITYGKNSAKSCDGIVVFGEMVLLVEVKSSRPPEKFRHALIPAEELGPLSKAAHQLEKTTQFISTGAAGFEGIPRDRPIRAMVVTLEPYFIGGTEAHEELFGTCGVPISEVFAEDFEAFCARHANNPLLGKKLLEAWPDGPRSKFRWLGDVEGGDPEARNPLIEKHWTEAIDLEGLRVIEKELNAADRSGLS